jgi:hypothetical protein
MDQMFMEAAERMMVGLETQARATHLASEHGVRVTLFRGHYLYQSLGASINAITRERAVALIAEGKRQQLGAEVGR